MAILKSYNLNTEFPNGLTPSALEAEIIAATVITGFDTVDYNGENLDVHGTTLDDGPGLDAVIAAHAADPDVPFSSSDSIKLSGIATAATANDTDANLKNRANHTGTQVASTISDFDTEVSNNPSVTANTAKVSFPEAPNDGNQYARKNLGWEQVAAGGTRTISDLSTGWITLVSGAGLFYTTDDRLYYGVVGNGDTGTLSKEFVIPADFTSFPANAFKIDIRANNIGGGAGLTVSIYKNGVVDTTINGLSLVPGTTNSWENKTSSFGSTYAPGDRILVKMVLLSASPGATNTFDMGMMTINYNA